jgi:hypothetical protein
MNDYIAPKIKEAFPNVNVEFEEAAAERLQQQG